MLVCCITAVWFVILVFVSTTPFIVFLIFFFFNDTATSEIYTLSLHDALPISVAGSELRFHKRLRPRPGHLVLTRHRGSPRSEEHTSELQSRPHLVCRLLLEKKKNKAVL